MIPTQDDFNQALERTKPFVHNTPILSSRLMNTMFGHQLFFKCENFQKMGAFKMRGAINAILQIPKDKRVMGVVTHSSGNFGQALALAAQQLNIPAYIVMPENAPKVKQEAVAFYGGQIISCASNTQARQATAEKIQEVHGAHFLHPSDDIDVILGNSTCAAELLDVHPDLDALFVPVGGGGIIAGTAIAGLYHSSPVKIFGGEPEQADDAIRSLAVGRIIKPKHTNTIADGLRTHLGDANFPIIQQCVDQIYPINESDILKHMKLVWQYLKIIIEPSCAVALAAVKQWPVSDKKIGVIITGGNVDLDNLPF